MGAGAEPTITDLLHASARGDDSVQDELWSSIYDELRCMARRYLTGERKDHTLQATALVHEAYMRMVDQRSCSWHDRSHFLAVAAKMMRRVLIDHARARGRAKRSCGQPMVVLDLVADVAEGATAEVAAVDRALRDLEQIDPFKASVVELRFFGGLTHAEVASVLGCSESTVRRHWPVAKAWLRVELGNASHGG